VPFGEPVEFVEDISEVLDRLVRTKYLDLIDVMDEHPFIGRSLELYRVER
jgi:hypothetical protein